MLNNNRKYIQGFTLIEVIVVIVLLSLLSVLGTKFIVDSTNSYQSTQTRSRLVNTGRQAVERMSRQLRIALPFSVRLTNVSSNTACLEFLPIAAGGAYLGYLSGGNYSGYVADSLNGANAMATISVAPHSVDFGAAQFVSIGATGPNELYGAGAVSRAILISRTNTLLTLSAATRWQRNSLNKRFYLLNAPQAFCIVASQLRFYANQDVTASAVDLTSAYSLLADNVASTTPFALTAGSENRNTIVQFNINFAFKGESVAFNNSVMIHNVP